MVFQRAAWTGGRAPWIVTQWKPWQEALESRHPAKDQAEGWSLGDSFRDQRLHV